MNKIRLKLLALTLSLLTACGSSEQDSTRFQPTISVEEMNTVLSEAQNKSISELISMNSTYAGGESLFIQHCASCHGVNGTGGKGVPDLTNGIWSWGGTEQDVYTGIAQGRHGVMQAFGRILGEVDQGQIVAYVQSLSDPSKRNTLAEYGEVLYKEHCVICHGETGEGLLPGAPNLADEYWQHGGSMMNIRLSIVRGVEGLCPPQAGILSETEMRLLTAYSLNLPAIN